MLEDSSTIPLVQGVSSTKAGISHNENRKIEHNAGMVCQSAGVRGSAHRGTRPSHINIAKGDGQALSARISNSSQRDDATAFRCAYGLCRSTSSLMSLSRGSTVTK